MESPFIYYPVLRSSGSDGYDYDLLDFDTYDDDSIERYDDMLYKTLKNILDERRLSTDQMKELFRASEDTDRQDSIIKQILEREPALSEIFPKGNELSSLLWIAVLCYYQKTAELIVCSGADVNERFPINLVQYDESYRNMTVFYALFRMYPSSWNERLIIDFITKRGADLKARDIDGNTVLHWAACAGRVQVTNLLLINGADVEAYNNENITPLLYAAEQSEADELLPMLMGHGADVKVRDTNGRNALYYLARTDLAFREHVDLARVLIEGGVSVHESDLLYSYQPLHEASSRGKNELVKLFLDHGADVNAREKHGEFPLYLATRCDKPKVLLTLLKRGANIDLTENRYRRTALHRICKDAFAGFDREQETKILLSAGADMFVEDRDGNTPYDIIARQDHPGDPYSLKCLMLQTLALRKACMQPHIDFKDERIIREKYPMHWETYQDCNADITALQSKSARFTTCTLFELLTKCQCQIAPLMWDPEFKIKFQLCISNFSDNSYLDDIREAFFRAEYYYHESMLGKLISEAVYNILHQGFVSKVVQRCEICEMKKIVQASRGSPDDGDDSN